MKSSSTKARANIKYQQVSKKIIILTLRFKTIQLPKEDDCSSVECHED
jgi:hypothetical protein